MPQNFFGMIFEMVFSPLFCNQKLYFLLMNLILRIS
eukprot:UN18494